MFSRRRIGINLKAEITRKSLHVSSLWMVVVIYFVDKETAISLFTGLLCLFFFAEYLRMTHKKTALLATKIFGDIMRPHEKQAGFKLSALSGSFYFLLAVLLSVFIFPKEIAIASIIIMILADTLAAIVGKSLGKHKILDKTLEGCLAFLMTSIIILYYYGQLTYYEIGLTALLLTLIELISNKFSINDNLSITLCAGSLIWFFT